MRALGHVEGEGGAPLRHQPHDAGSRHPRHHVGPGAGGVDHDRCLEGSGAGRDGPVAIGAELHHLGIGHHLAAAGAETLEESVMDRVHVHVAGVRLPDRGLGVTGLEERHLRRELVGADHRDRVDRAAAFFQRHRQRGLLIVAADQQGAAGAQQRMLGETLRRRLEEGPAGAGDRADRPVAVDLGIERGGAAGGVVARLGFAFEHDDPGVAGELVGGGGAGDAGADHDEVGGLCHGGA
jgi:hypothetical protein